MGSENDADVELLLHDPLNLILKYQDIIKIIVRKFISSGMFDPGDFDDFVQTINQSLVEKIPSLQKQYNGNALLKTYCSAVIRNICLKIFEHRKHEVPTVDLDEINLTSNDNIVERMEIEYHIKRFETILQMYSNKKQKLVFHLKLYFRFPITKEDTVRYFIDCSPKDEETLHTHFGGNYDLMTLQEIYSLLGPFLNRYERKSNNVDTARRWIDDKIEEIITLLNGQPPRFSYDKESMKILAEKYFLQLDSKKGYIWGEKE